MDWEAFFPIFEKIKNEIKEVLPYHCIEVEHAEADDIIATIVKMFYKTGEEICIVSSDNDMIQLQKYGTNIVQWSPRIKKFLNYENTQYNLMEHIVGGDANDGIPNIWSDDDTCVTEKRMKTFSSKRKEIVTSHNFQISDLAINKNEVDKFKRNAILIDLDKIPDDIVKDIKEAVYNNKPPKGKLFNYLIQNQCMKLLDSANDF